MILTPMADSLVKEGKLPDWLTPKVEGFFSFFTTTTPWALWELMAIVLFIAGVAIFVAHRDSRSLALKDGHVDRLSVELDECSKRCAALEAANTHLEASEARLKESNAALTKQIAELPPALEEAKLTDVVFDMLEAFTVFANQGARATLVAVSAVTSLIPLEVHAAVDVLIERRFLIRCGGLKGEYYELTPAGRAYYIKHR
ncbi:hypothetical protein [Pseudomonas sp. BIGb0164]|uniref:hypothetical protein n=1 Tax=Pseudomonas sp. BIGb0164 TaxID=2940605 RepID=UPI002167FCEE|nr:hypothetical protein [Pseudomonas sp. BIGb0164]MCS4246208.1 uncharacterized protein YceH (UPF0502 family) [Pseudomonas sp. BIGb0164]